MASKRAANRTLLGTFALYTAAILIAGWAYDKRIHRLFRAQEGRLRQLLRIRERRLRKNIVILMRAHTGAKDDQT